jgi:hypothetical protein
MVQSILQFIFRIPVSIFETLGQMNEMQFLIILFTILGIGRFSHDLPFVIADCVGMSIAISFKL